MPTTSATVGVAWERSSAAATVVPPVKAEARFCVTCVPDELDPARYTGLRYCKVVRVGRQNAPTRTSSPTESGAVGNTGAKSAERVAHQRCDVIVKWIFHSSAKPRSYFLMVYPRDTNVPALTPADQISVEVCQTAGKFGDPWAALEELTTAVGRASARGIDIVVFPELFLTGYNLGKSRVHILAETVSGGLLAQIHDVARRNAVAIVFGYPELVGANKVANAAMFIAADGRTLLNYRKVHLYGDLDREMFEVRGDAFPVVSYRGWVVGLAICYDIEFPETARILALQGADCLLIPTALMPPYEIVPRAVIPARGYEEQIYLAYANHCGAEGDISYIGNSCICGPDGSVVASAGAGPDCISATLDKQRIAAVRAGESLLSDRRPQLYGRISS